MDNTYGATAKNVEQLIHVLEKHASVNSVYLMWIALGHLTPATLPVASSLGQELQLLQCSFLSKLQSVQREHTRTPVMKKWEEC